MNIKKDEYGISAEKSLLIFGLVSSGKSTLVNAFLGKQIMPVSNLSCTSLTVKVADELSEMKYGEAFYKKENYSIPYDKKDAVSALYYYNNDIKCDGEFVLHGSLNRLNKGSFKLTLIDTPGINDALSAKRSDIAKKSIHRGKYTALLYISHIRTCATTDEEACLRNAADIIRCCGDNDWFFAVNGWDLKDEEEEDSYTDKIRMLADRCSIPQPHIFFISAYGALMCRRALSGEKLSRKDKKELEHLLRYYGVYTSIKRIKAENDRLDKNVINGVLTCTGVPRLEEALYQSMKK